LNDVNKDLLLLLILVARTYSYPEILKKLGQVKPFLGDVSPSCPRIHLSLHVVLLYAVIIHACMVEPKYTWMI